MADCRPDVPAFIAPPPQRLLLVVGCSWVGSYLKRTTDYPTSNGSIEMKGSEQQVNCTMAGGNDGGREKRVKDNTFGLYKSKGIKVTLLVVIVISLKYIFIDFTRWQKLYEEEQLKLAEEWDSPSIILGNNNTIFKEYLHIRNESSNELIEQNDMNQKIKIAFATTLTGCKRNDPKFLQLGAYAAVLQRSLKDAYAQSTKYDYDLIMFVHPSATDCAPLFTKLGYQIQIRDTPFNDTEIQNDVLQREQKVGCCGSKEYLKLYSYLLFDYPLVVHLDLDVIVLKPMDDAFDMFLTNSPANNDNKVAVAWKESLLPNQIDFMFTRDYNMVDPPKRKPHQIGVQGGFLMVRPNATDFDRMVKIILGGGNYTVSHGWGGKAKAHGGYYGAATIQGLASYYYGSVSTGRSVELNRCYYNAMVDDPYNTPAFVQDTRQPPGKTKLMCRTLEPELNCQDCRQTPLEEIFMAHFTVCGKPHFCSTPIKWWYPKMLIQLPNATIVNANTNTETTPQLELCMELFREWHKVRRSIEDEWQQKFLDYHPTFHTVPSRKVDQPIESYASSYYQNYSYGHCPPKGGMVPMSFPKAFWDDENDDPII